MNIKKIIEQVPCPLCGDQKNIPIYFEESVFFEAKIKMGVNECRNCQLCYVSPRLNSSGLTKLYNSLYKDETVSGQYNTDEVVSLAEYDQFVKYLSAYNNLNSSVLDVGCGVGLLLKKLQTVRSDLQIKGVEFSSFAAEKAVEKGFDVKVGDFSKDQIFSPGTFDSIVFLYVLEHVPNPLDFLKSAYSTLKEDGTLFLAVPNYTYLKIVKTGLLSRILFKKHSNLHTLEHLINYSPKTIVSLLIQAGFQVEYIGQAKPLNIGTPLFRFVKKIGYYLSVLSGVFGFYIGGIHVVAKKT